MRFIQSKYVGVALALSTMFMGVSVQASSLTNAQVSAILGLLQSFGADQSVVANVAADLGATSTAPQMGTTTPGFPGMNGLPPGQVGKMMCIALNRDLRLGSKGDDVKSIQQFLNQNGFTVANSGPGSQGNETNTFGPATMRAMMNFQHNNGISSSGNGSVGPLTRGFFERKCGEGLGKDTNGGDNNQEGNGDHGQPGMMGVSGNITSVGSSTVTVQTPFGTPLVINWSASTTVEVYATSTGLATPGSSANLVVGANIIAAGTRNTDGTFTATDIKIGMPMRTSGGQQMMMTNQQQGDNNHGAMPPPPWANGQGGPNHF
jgi:peptidoglycan hydrolase-like protein with peptidoglycan-binding domain